MTYLKNIVKEKIIHSKNEIIEEKWKRMNRNDKQSVRKSFKKIKRGDDVVLTLSKRKVAET